MNTLIWNKAIQYKKIH